MDLDMIEKILFGATVHRATKAPGKLHISRATGMGGLRLYLAQDTKAGTQTFGIKVLVIDWVIGQGN
tara:strand:+ start:13608 stop:13808 length:201 start_codon:yes stop_codon:yes gene_type:complete